jgi:MFS family permease
MTTNERANSPNPANAHQEKKMDMKSKLSTLWIFAALNYLYCDVVGLMDRELLRQFLTGNVDGIPVTQGFLLGASILVEIPIAMVLLSRVLPYRANRWANIAAGALMTAVQSASLFVGAPTPYYLFFSVIEIATTVLIVWFAWNWREPVGQVELNEPELSASRR